METAEWNMDWMEIISCFAGSCVSCIPLPEEPEWEQGELVHEDLAGRVCSMKESDGSIARSPTVHNLQHELGKKKKKKGPGKGVKRSLLERSKSLLSSAKRERERKCGIVLNSCIFSFFFGSEGPLPLAQKNVEKTLWFEIRKHSFYTEWRRAQCKRDGGWRGEGGGFELFSKSSQHFILKFCKCNWARELKCQDFYLGLGSLFLGVPAKVRLWESELKWSFSKSLVAYTVLGAWSPTYPAGLLLPLSTSLPFFTQPPGTSLPHW